MTVGGRVAAFWVRLRARLPLGPRPCTCGHERSLHEHYSSSTHCSYTEWSQWAGERIVIGRCPCVRYRPRW